jgi:phospholipid transport system substrate-binding protein
MLSIHTRRGCLAMLGLLGLLALPPAAHPQQAAGAEAFMGELAKETLEVLRTTQVNSSERQARLRTILEKGFDLPYLAQLAVGREWRDMSEADRQRFIEVFTVWVLRTQAARLGQYAGQEFAVEGSQRASERDTMVTTRISGGNLDRPVQVDWRVRETDGHYGIIDVVIEGVSMVVTYRNEFQAILGRGGVEALEAELRARAGQP